MAVKSKKRKDNTLTKMLLWYVGIVVAIAFIGGGLMVLNNILPQSFKKQIFALKASSVKELPVPSSYTSERRYLLYSPEVYAKLVDKKRVLYFHATWCITCRYANNVFVTREKEIPSDVVIFRVNYDSADSLKKKYNIVYEHAFVWVDRKDQALGIWYGRDLDLLYKNVK